MTNRSLACVAYAAWIAALAASCADDDPRYGPPGSIRDRSFGGAPGADDAGASASAFPGPFDAASPPPAGEPLVPRHPYRQLDDTVDCLECHKTGGTAAAKPWAFGGRVNDGRDAGATVREVIVKTAAGAIVGHVKATSDGFFWAPGAPASNARAAVRNDEGDEVPMGTPASGGCNAGGTCHGGATGPIVVPR